MAKALVPWRGKTDPQPPAKREDLYDPFVTFRREVNRMFDDVFHGVFDGFGSRALSPYFDSWSGAPPTMDVEETEREIVISAELPGLDHKDFEVTVSGDVLTLKGEKKEERERKHRDAHYVERRFGFFSRSVRLPFEVKNEKVYAHYDKGVLTIRIPKPAQLQRPVRRINVRTV